MVRSEHNRDRTNMMVQHVYCTNMLFVVLVNILISVVLGNLNSQSKKHSFNVFSVSEP